MSFFRMDGTVATPVGQAIAGVEVYVCSQPATTDVIPPSPLVELYSAPTSNSVAVESATWSLGLLTLVLASIPSDLVVDSFIQVLGANPSAFNGVYTVEAVDTDTNTVTLDLATNPGAYVGSATVQTSALPNPTLSDGLGNFFFYAPSGTYTIVYYDPNSNVPTQVFPDQDLPSPGAGTVTNVALTGDGVIFASSIPGSPVTTSGTLNLAAALNLVNALYLLSGPLSGSAAAPSYKSLSSILAAAGLGSGTVTSVGFAATQGASLFTLSVTGSPITTNGTITLTVNLANQAANTMLAGPASGGSGPITARQPVAADICGAVAVSFSATPVFNAALFALPAFLMTLTGNVVSSTVSNPTVGQTITFALTQDGTGGRTFAWPANFKGASVISPDANAVSVQSFVYDGTNFRATSAGLSTGS